MQLKKVNIFIKPQWRRSVLFAVWLTFLIVGKSSAQDIHFSQYESSPLNLNPALTGFYNGDLRFIANHRSQWKSVTEPYQTFSGSFDMVLNRLSASKNRYNAGIIFNNDKAGDSGLGMFQAGISFSGIRALDSDSKHNLSAGIQLSYVRRSIDYSKLTFDQQYNGDVYDPNSGNTENFSGSNHGYADVGLGVGYLYKSSDKFKIGSGISLQHINRPDDSFFNSKVKLFPRLQFDIHADAALNNTVALLPSVLIMNQGGNRELTGGTSARLTINNKPGRYYAFYLGAFLRTGDAFIASTGLDYNNLNIGLSYDFNTSDLDRASNGKGGYELSLIYIIQKVKPLGIKPPCPLY